MKMKISEKSNPYPLYIDFTNDQILDDNNKLKQDKEASIYKTNDGFFFKIAVFVCFLVVFVYYYSQNKMEKEVSNSSKRNLLSHQEYLSLCYNNNTNTILGFDITKLNTYNVAFNDYISTLNNYDKSNEIYIEQAVSGNFNSIWQLAKKLLIPYMIVAAFSGIAFISWFVFCGCHFRKSFCCKSDEVIEPKRGCKLVSLVIFTLSITVIILFSFLGIIFSFNLLKKMDEFECLLLQFYSDAKYGQINTEHPRWIGYDKIPSFIYDLQNNYVSIENEFKSIFRKADWVEKERTKFIAELDNIWEKHRSEKKVNPNAESTDKVITPDIIEHLGKYDKSFTYLNYMFVEYEVDVKLTSDLNDELRESFSSFLKSNNDARYFFNNVTESFIKGFQNFDLLDEKYISYVKTYKEEFSFRLRISVFSLYIGTIFLLIGLYLIVIFFVCCDSKQMILWINILWNVITLLNIILFAVSAVIGTLGVFFIYFAPAAKIVISPSNMVKLTNNQEVAYVMDECLNFNGDLSKSWISSNSKYYQHLELFYNSIYQLNDNYYKLRSFNSMSFSLYKTIEYFDKKDKNIGFNIHPAILYNEEMFKNITEKYRTYFKKDYNLTESITDLIKITEYNYALNKLNEYSNMETVPTLQIKCNNFLKDRFISDNEECPNLYLYLRNNVTNLNVGSRSCLILNEWDEQKLNSRYEIIPNGCQPPKSFNSISEGVIEFVKSLNEYEEKSRITISSILNQLNSLNENMRIYYEKISVILDGINRATEYSNDLIRFNLNGKNFFDIFNCKFMSKNMNSIVSKANDLGKNFITLFVFTSLISFFVLISLYSGLTYYWRKFSIDELKQEMLEEEEAQSDLRKLEVMD